MKPILRKVTLALSSVCNVLGALMGILVVLPEHLRQAPANFAEGVGLWALPALLIIIGSTLRYFAKRTPKPAV